MHIGLKIKKRRMELHWSQRELSRRMGYGNHSTVGKIEAGKVDVPQSRIRQFADVLGVSISYLMDWEEVQKNNDILTDIIVKLRSDLELLSIVDSISKLDANKRSAVQRLLSAFLE